MLTQTMIDSAAVEIAAMIAIAITGGIGIYGSIKGVMVGLKIFSKLAGGSA